MIKHLKLKHKSEHGEFAASSNVSTQQPTLQQTFARWEKMTRDNSRAKKITEVLRSLLLTINRFQSLITWDFVALLHVTDIVLPQIHHAVKKHVVCMLHYIKAISFTTDIWSCSVNPLSLISLTVQWIDGDFTLQQIMLHAKQFRGSHSGLAIASVFEEMLATWAIPKSSILIVLLTMVRQFTVIFHCALLIVTQQWTLLHSVML